MWLPGSPFIKVWPLINLFHMECSLSLLASGRAIHETFEEE